MHDMYITMYIYVIYILKKVLNQILCCTCSPAEQTELLAFQTRFHSYISENLKILRKYIVVIRKCFSLMKLEAP